MWKQRRGHREDRGHCGGCDDHDATRWALCREDGTELGVGIAEQGRGIGELGAHPPTPAKVQRGVITAVCSSSFLGVVYTNSLCCL